MVWTYGGEQDARDNQAEVLLAEDGSSNCGAYYWLCQLSTAEDVPEEAPSADYEVFQVKETTGSGSRGSDWTSADD